MLTSDFNEKIKDFISSDRAFTFMNGIKRTLVYWIRFLFESCPLSSQLISKISTLIKQDLPDEYFQELPYNGRCRLLNSKPVLFARHFQDRFQVFFKEIIVDGTLGKIICHAIWLEFQVRGLPHILCFLSVLNAPTLPADSKEEYISFVDNVLHAYLSEKLYN